MAEPSYVLGHTEDELARLGRQARLVDPITRGFLLAVGLGPGMRVLDVGSGAGHTATLIADLVGPGGEVVGADLSPVAVATARRRIAEAGLANVSFVQGDPATTDFGRPFDAVVGRYVLMFVPEPARLLAGLAPKLRPGGILAFHDPDWDGARCVPPVPAFDRVCADVRAALVAGGADDVFGTRAGAVFADAGLPPATLMLAATIGAGPSADPVVRLVTELATTLRPDLERLGRVTAADRDYAEVTEAILAELGPRGTVIGRQEIAACTRV